MTVLGPDDPRAITDPEEVEEARMYTEWFNEAVLGLKPRSAKAKARQRKKLDAILREIGRTS